MHLQLAPPPFNPSAALECRVYERTPCELAVSCQPAAGSHSAEAIWPATICDISQGGVRLMLARRFERGAALAIELPAAAGQHPYPVFAKVVHLRREDDGSWALGCKFISALSEEEIRRLTQSAKPKTRIAVARVHCHLTIRPGTVLDYVINRLQVKDWPLEAGRALTLRGGAGEARWTIKTTVDSCRELGQGWDLSCRLATPFSAARLLEALSSAR